MDSRHTIWTSIGGAVLLLGAAGFIPLVIWAGSSPNLHLWDDRLFDAAVGLFALAGVGGAYALFSPLHGLPMPGPRSQPFWRRNQAPIDSIRQLVPTPQKGTDAVAPRVDAVPARATTTPQQVAARHLIKRTPEELIGMYANANLAIEGKRLVAPYIGKWIQVEGSVEDLSELEQVGLYRLGIKEHPQINMWFHAKEWLERIVVLRKGDHVIAQGQIETIDATRVSLDPCELVD